MVKTKDTALWAIRAKVDGNHWDKGRKPETFDEGHKHQLQTETNQKFRTSKDTTFWLNLPTENLWSNAQIHLKSCVITCIQNVSFLHARKQKASLKMILRISLIYWGQTFGWKWLLRLSWSIILSAHCYSISLPWNIITQDPEYKI